MPSLSPSPLVTKRVAHLPELALRCGQTLSGVTIGYETYGALNDARDNAVLVCHYFSGASNAAGSYREDGLSGWWDAVIGPGKAIDTDRYFVVAIDALGCVRIDAPHGVTTNAASLDPQTGRPYGPNFPAIAISDMVASQRAVLDQLGVDRLAAVAGPSLGAMQALAWATERPDEVDRVIAAIGPDAFRPREIGLYRVMEDAIRLDSAFMGGWYNRSCPPREGLATAIKLMMLLAGGREVLEETFGRRGEDDVWAVEQWLDREARTRAEAIDANSWIAMLRANMRWALAEADIRRLSARVLLLPALGDDLLPMRAYHTPLEQALMWRGADFKVQPLPARHGHLAGLAVIAHGAAAIRACLAEPR